VGVCGVDVFCVDVCDVGAVEETKEEEEEEEEEGVNIPGAGIAISTATRTRGCSVFRSLGSAAAAAAALGFGVACRDSASAVEEAFRVGAAEGAEEGEREEAGGGVGVDVWEGGEYEAAKGWKGKSAPAITEKGMYDESEDGDANGGMYTGCP
jgi:hypothetical protein